MARFRRILHASDFSPASRAAFTTAVRLARADRARLILVHVLTPVIAEMGEAYLLPQTYQQLEASARAYADRRLTRLLDKATRAGVRARGLLLTGLPPEAIVRAARSWRADLVVIGTHGRTGLPRLFLGSVAARVIALAPCPVLTVRGR